jgi:hypothetical protein
VITKKQEREREGNLSIQNIKNISARFYQQVDPVTVI